MISKASVFFLTAILGVVLVLSTATRTPSHSSQKSDSGDDKAHGTQGRRLSLDDTKPEVITVPGEEQRGQSPEKISEISPIRIPFRRRKGLGGNGIRFTSSGEPKSGTTWIQGVITVLAVNLCGSSTNPWCEMGGLNVLPKRPAPSYEFEMIQKNTSTLFLRFEGRKKHPVPGLNVKHDCNPKGRAHPNNFETESPCTGKRQGPMTRKKLLECLPDTSPRCAQYLPSQDPAVQRISVLFRDPRNLVISEHRMRTKVYLMKGISELDPFIYERLEVIVSWMHQRWTWHTTYLADVSHVMFYEDLQENSLGLSSLAQFMGLDCSPEQAQAIWEANRYESRPADYNSYGLPVETIEWMNVTMARLLPEEMVTRWGLTPIFTKDN